VTPLLLVLLQDGTTVEKADHSPFYPVPTGARWRYRVAKSKVNQRILRHERVGDVVCALIETLRDGKVVCLEHISATGEGVYRYSFDGERLDPPLRILKLPPASGDTWAYAYKLGEESVRGNFVVSEEEVKVPAGKFKAIVSRTEDCVAGEQRLSITYWFAHGVGIVKQTVRVGDQEAVTLELEEYFQPK
jgi:hypothetical protein